MSKTTLAPKPKPSPKFRLLFRNFGMLCEYDCITREEAVELAKKFYVSVYDIIEIWS